MVRKGERLHEHVLMGNSYPFCGTGDRGRMNGMKRVEGCQKAVVQLDADPPTPGFAGEESVKDQLKMGSCLIHLAHELVSILTGAFVWCSEAEFLPDDQRTAVAELIRPWDGCQIVRHLDCLSV